MRISSKILVVTMLSVSLMSGSCAGAQAQMGNALSQALSSISVAEALRDVVKSFPFIDQDGDQRAMGTVASSHSSALLTSWEGVRGADDGAILSAYYHYIDCSKWGKDAGRCKRIVEKQALAEAIVMAWGIWKVEVVDVVADVYMNSSSEVQAELGVMNLVNLDAGGKLDTSDAGKVFVDYVDVRGKGQTPPGTGTCSFVGSSWVGPIGEGIIYTTAVCTSSVAPERIVDDVKRATRKASIPSGNKIVQHLIGKLTGSSD